MHIGTDTSSIRKNIPVIENERKGVMAGVGVSLEALHFGEARDGTVFGEA